MGKYVAKVRKQGSQSWEKNPKWRLASESRDSELGMKGEEERNILDMAERLRAYFREVKMIHFVGVTLPQSFLLQHRSSGYFVLPKG